jgi:hypothetical protein
MRPAACRADEERIHSGLAYGVVREDQAAGNQGMPFANLPEKKARRWGEGLTVAKMAECRWLKPLLVGQV